MGSRSKANNRKAIPPQGPKVKPAEPAKKVVKPAPKPSGVLVLRRTRESDMVFNELLKRIELIISCSRGPLSEEFDSLRQFVKLHGEFYLNPRPIEEFLPKEEVASPVPAEPAKAASDGDADKRNSE